MLSFSLSERFSHLSSFERVVYYVALVASGITLVLILAPTVYGRLLVDHDARAAQQWSAWMLAGGMVSLAVTIVATVVLAMALGSSSVGVALVGCALAAVLAVFWLAVPFSARR